MIVDEMMATLAMLLSVQMTDHIHFELQIYDLHHLWPPLPLPKCLRAGNDDRFLLEEKGHLNVPMANLFSFDSFPIITVFEGFYILS